MKRPITHVTINEKGEIQEIHADLRLYEPLTRRHHTPPLHTLFSLTNDALLLPDGTSPQQPLVQHEILWTVTVAPFINPEFLQDCPEPEKIPTFIQLRSWSSPQTAIDLLIEPNTNPCNPKNSESKSTSSSTTTLKASTTFYSISITNQTSNNASQPSPMKKRTADISTMFLNWSKTSSSYEDNATASK